MDISFKFNVFKTFLFIPAIIVGGHMAGAIGVTLGFLLVQIVNTVLSYFVMIKPVLGPSYRQYILSLWLPFYLLADACGELRPGRGAQRTSAAGGAACGAGRGRRAGVWRDDCAVTQCAGGRDEAPVLP